MLGPLDADALEKALNAVVARYEVLRASIRVVHGTPSQLIHPEVKVPFTHLDLRAHDMGGREAEVRRLALIEAERRFDLGIAPPMRATLICVANDHHVLLLTLHHIASDGPGRSRDSTPREY